MSVADPSWNHCRSRRWEQLSRVIGVLGGDELLSADECIASEFSRQVRLWLLKGI